jgi:Family of unknown function (DUF6492)
MTMIAPRQTMDAVLPVLVQDLERASILLRSLRRNFSGLGTLWVVTRPEQVAEVERVLAAQPGPWQLRVLSEVELVPEFAATRLLRGWYRQQLVKLAIAERIQTENYLTLDADVICVRAATPDQLAPEGKGLCHVIPEDLHPDWYQGSIRVLGLTPRRKGVLHNVTPAVLNRAAVLSMQGLLSERAQAGRYRADWLGLRQRFGFALARLRKQPHIPWRWYLMLGAPWTEYALYYTYLEATGQFDRYHRLTPDCIYAIEQSVWRAGAATFDSWDPAPLFTGSGAPYFAIVQSITRLAPERVWAKVAPFL